MITVNSQKYICAYAKIMNDIVEANPMQKINIIEALHQLYIDARHDNKLLVFLSYALDNNVKKEFITDILDEYNLEVFTNLFHVALEFNHAFYFVDIIRQFLDNISKNSDIINFKIHTRFEITAEQKNKIDAALKKYLNKEVISTIILDKNMLGGLYIEGNEIIFDYTINYKLNKLFEQLNGGLA